MKGHDVMITAPKELVQLLETLKDKWIQTHMSKSSRRTEYIIFIIWR